MIATAQRESETPVVDTAPVTAEEDTGGQTRPIVRLSINLAPDVAEVLRGWCKTKGLSITEGVRRAISVWNFMETARRNGNRFALIESTADGDRVREVMLID